MRFSQRVPSLRKTGRLTNNFCNNQLPIIIRNFQANAIEVLVLEVVCYFVLAYVFACLEFLVILLNQNRKEKKKF